MVRLLAAMLRGQDRWRTGSPRPSAPRPGGRVLFLRPDRIGDMIVSTGVLRAIGSAPGVELDVLASPANAPVLTHEPSVRATHVLDRHRWRAVWRTVRALRQRRYDVVVDCMPTAPSVTTLLLMLVSGAARRVGTSGRGIDTLFEPAVPSLPHDRHIVDLLAVLVRPFRDDTPSVAPKLELHEHELEQGEMRWRETGAPPFHLRLLVNISAGKQARDWPLESYAAVIDAARARETAMQVAIIAAPHDRHGAESLAARTGSRYVDTHTLRAACAVVARADALFTPDTGIAHAAAALRVPTVDMLLVGRASQWGLYRAPGINLESPDESLQSLPVQQAADALCQLLHTLRKDAQVAPRGWPRNELMRGRATGEADGLMAASASTRLGARRSY